MQAFLKKHGPGAALHSIKVNWQREGRKVTVSFSVQKRSSAPWLYDEVFTEDYTRNWGLWNKDVVECFLQLRETTEDLKAPYLEIQVSPLNRPFALVITEPRQKYFVPQNLEFKTMVSIQGRTWTGTMEVNLPPELKGGMLYGGFFSCLAQDPREFYALEPNPESNPDFHRPELFLILDEQ